MSRLWQWRLAVLSVALLLAFPAPRAHAQARSHAFAGLSAGFADWPIVAGGDWLIGGRALGVQGEFSLFTFALGGSFHVLHEDREGPLDPFVVVDYRTFTDLNGVDGGIGFGGGVVFWLGDRFGLRVDGLRFLAIRDEIRTSHHHWGVRAALAISFGSSGSN
jgi:hypothetical protein